jgi:hypothetical protein
VGTGRSKADGPGNIVPYAVVVGRAKPSYRDHKVHAPVGRVQEQGGQLPGGVSRDHEAAKGEAEAIHVGRKLFQEIAYVVRLDPSVVLQQLVAHQDDLGAHAVLKVVADK